MEQDELWVQSQNAALRAEVLRSFAFPEEEDDDLKEDDDAPSTDGEYRRGSEQQPLSSSETQHLQTVPKTKESGEGSSGEPTEQLRHQLSQMFEYKEKVRVVNVSNIMIILAEDGDFSDSEREKRVFFCLRALKRTFLQREVLAASGLIADLQVGNFE